MKREEIRRIRKGRKHKTQKNKENQHGKKGTIDNDKKQQVIHKHNKKNQYETVIINKKHEYKRRDNTNQKGTTKQNQLESRQVKQATT